MSPTPHTAVWEDLYRGLPLPRRPQRGTLRGVWCLRPSVLRCQQLGFVCVPGCRGWQCASQQPGTCTAMELQGAGVRTGSEPWPWGRRTAGKNSRRQSPSTLLRGPSRALATSTHCSSAAVAWVRGNNSGIACRRGREKVVQATSWPNSERKTRRFLHCPGEAERPTADVGGTQTWAVRLHWPESRALSKGLAQCPSCLRFE